MILQCQERVYDEERSLIFYDVVNYPIYQVDKSG